MTFAILLPDLVPDSANVIAQIAFPHRYFRMEFLGTSDSFLSIAEIKVAETVGGADIAAGKTITASGDSGSSNTIANAFDGDLGTDWTAPTTGNTGTVTIDFGSPKTVAEVRIAPRNGLPQRAPTSIRFLTSDDGTTYTLAWSATATSADYTTGQYKSFPRP